MKFNLSCVVALTTLQSTHGFTVPKISSSWAAQSQLRIPNIIDNKSYSKLVHYTISNNNEDVIKQESQEKDAVLSKSPDEATVEKMGDLATNLSTNDIESSTPTKVDNSKIYAGTAFFFVLDYVLRKVFQAKGITFPSMMGGCVLTFSALVALETVKKGLGDKIFNYLTPSSDKLVKWLPVFFVPGMAMLPLSPINIGNAMDVMKIMAMIPLGFFFTLLTTAYSVLTVRKLQGKLDSNTAQEDTKVEADESRVGSGKPIYRRIKPYSTKKVRNLLVTSGLFGALSIGLTQLGHANAIYYTPVMTTFMICSTLGAFALGNNFSPKVTSLLHPIMTATTYTWGIVALFAAITGSSFGSVLSNYRVGSANLLHAGAGDLLLYMLGPGVCSLSIAMYSRKTLMKSNLAAVLVGMLVSSTGGILSSALYVRFANIPGALLRLSLITRNVTTALAMALTDILGGNTAIIASLLVTTGVFGSTFVRKFLDKVKIYDPVSRGLGVGAAAQGIGVASLKEEKDSLPFAAINMILTALCSSVLISIPVFREFVKRVALGGV